MAKYEQLAKDILQLVGGSKNIDELWHCATRLRFLLKDDSLAKTEELKNLDGVVNVIKAGGQYQVVIGTHVESVFEEIQKIEELSVTSDNSEVRKKQSFFNVLIDAISGCFQPFLPILAGAGMIRGFVALFAFIGLLEQGSSTFILLDQIGDSVFYFMPVIIGLTAARKFKVNEFVGLLLGAALMNPQLFNMLSSGGAEPIKVLFNGTMFESPIYHTVFGLPLTVRDYAGSIIPIIFIILFAAQVQKQARKLVPEVIANFFVPFFTILISLPIGFLLVGPLFTFATDVFVILFEALLSFNSVIYAAILAFAWQILVMFGLHWAVIPMAFMQFNENGFQDVLTPMVVVSFGQTAGLIALYFKLESKKDKAVALPAIVSGFAGITEPAIYRFTLPRKKVFIYTCIGSAFGGAFVGWRRLTARNLGGSGVFNLPNFIRPDGDLTDLITILTGIAIASALSFLFTWLFHKEPDIKDISNATSSDAITVDETITIGSPVKGNVRSLSEARDSAFSDGGMGQGVVVDLEIGEIRSPFDGIVSVLFPTLHAIGLTSMDGVDIFIYIGLETVNLNGEGFEALVSLGDKVKDGDLLLKFDIIAVKQKGIDVETPITITNFQDFNNITCHTGSKNFGEKFFSVI